MVENLTCEVTLLAEIALNTLALTNVCIKLRNEIGFDRDFLGQDLHGMPQLNVRFLQVERLLLDLVHKALVVLLENRRFVGHLRLAHRNRLTLHPACELFYTLQHGRGIERLAPEGVCTEPVSKTFIRQIGVRGGVEHEWHMAQTLIRLPCPAQLIAVHLRHKDVSDEEVRDVGASHIESLLAVHCRENLMPARAHDGLQQVAPRRVIINDKHPHGNPSQ
jgi:hypothetical protein